MRKRRVNMRVKMQKYVNVGLIYIYINLCINLYLRHLSEVYLYTY